MRDGSIDEAQLAGNSHSIRGGDWSGKSVIALSLVSHLDSQEYSSSYITND